MGEYGRVQKNQLCTVVKNGNTGNRQLKGFVDNRPETARISIIQQKLKKCNQIKQCKNFNGNTNVDQIVAVRQSKAGYIVPVRSASSQSYCQSGVKLLSYKENTRNTISRNLIQMKIAHTDTIGVNENLQHGSNVKTFTTEEGVKEIQVPNGPAWFTLNSDGGLVDNGTPFNLHAALLEISGSGKIYVHRLKTHTALDIITFEDHKDAINKLREDKKVSFEFYIHRESFAKSLWEAHCKDVMEERYPMANDKRMAGKISEQSEVSVKGYKYEKDLIRGEPEVVIYKPEDDVIQVTIVEYDVSEWEGDEANGFSRNIVPTDGGDSYQQVSLSKGSPNCIINKITR